MHLSQRGFAIVNANYRLVPEVSFRDQLTDAIAVLDWMAARCDEYGLDTDRVFIIGDSAATLLDLYLCAVLHSPIVADRLRINPGTGNIRIRAAAGVSGMYRFTGGVHSTAMSYYYEAYFPTLKERIDFDPYLDMDRLMVDGNLPPIYMLTSAEDYLADNTLEFARILQHRHHDYEVRVLPKGLDHALTHDFSVRETGLPHNAEAIQVVDDIAGFFGRYC
ncbi:alpha/beta hydrolase fold protein [Bifidobacterium reuteri DSM 23975]|uniref:Alpha/beta hydrolase fold protein n=2 Tax=Bifidobacterium reuteri TaxID=983706 RepID=A0A087CEI4_9BIFI|nr:alpha/beta hydrolase fold protein [Bifidobacterium reuteri DSM 23975]